LLFIYLSSVAGHCQLRHSWQSDINVYKTCFTTTHR